MLGRIGTGIRLGLVAASAATVLATVGTGEAKDFRYAGFYPITTLEPMYNQPELYGFLYNMMEALTDIAADGSIEPVLAERWEQVEPERWRFYLRRNVKFHDGDTFDADDVIFTARRSRHPNATMGSPLARINEFIKVDDYTVDVTTKGINPITPRDLGRIPMMSKEWTEKNKAVEVPSRAGNDESYVTRNVNGTGAFILRRLDPGISMEMVPNPNWWGGVRADAPTAVKYFTIASGATQTAALLAGEVDLVYGLSPDLVSRLERSPGIRVMTTRNTTVQFLGMNQGPDELPNSNVKGKNPFRDKRVRQAVFYAIDIDAIIEKIFRGYAFPAGITVAPQVFGYDADLDKREKPDIEKARRLMAEAGYPNGFMVQLDSVANYWVKGEEMGEAITVMLAKIGIEARLMNHTFAQWSTIVQRPRFEGTMYLNSSATVSQDAGSHLELLYPRRNGSQNNNASGGGSPELDELIARQARSMDQQERLRVMREAWKVIKDDMMMVPLLEPAVIWAVRDGVTTPVDPVNRVRLSKVSMK